MQLKGCESTAQLWTNVHANAARLAVANRTGSVRLCSRPDYFV